MAEQGFAPRLVTLVVDEPRGVLEPFEVESPWKMECCPVIDEAARRFGVDVSVVRVLSMGHDPGGPVTYLVEAPAIDPRLLGPFASRLARSSLRPDFAEVGGVARLIAWADDAVAAVGGERTGSVRQVRTWNLSCLLRLETTLGRLWLKAVPSFFAHEGAVIELLATRAPERVPRVLASMPGTTLMADTSGVDGYDIDLDTFVATLEAIVPAMGSLSVEELRAAGVPEFTEADIGPAIVDLAERHGAQLTSGEREHLDRLIDEAGDRWRAGGDRLGLVHGDLHGGNISLRSDGPNVVLDWGDASVTHPLMELAVLDSYRPHWADEVIDPWLEMVGCTRSQWEAFRPLAAVRLAIVYRMFCDRIEPAERVYHRTDIVSALRKGLKSVPS
jgi:hypothetical protein